jgi:alpha-L-fucosidase 2
MKITTPVFLLLASLAGASSAASTADYIKSLTGIYQNPGINYGGRHADGPFAGNGDMRVVLLGTEVEQTYHINQAAMWTDGDPRPVTTGGLTISAQPAEGRPPARFSQEHHLWDAHITAHSSAGYHTNTIVCSTENVMITELWTDDAEPLPVTVSLWTKADNVNLPASAGIEGDLMWATRETTPGKRWIARNALAAKIIGAKAALTPSKKGTVSAAFTLTKGQKIRIVTVLKGGRNVEPPLPAATLRAKELDPHDLETLQADHVRWWRNFWAGPSLRAYDDDWDKVYFGSLYLMACVNRPGTTPPGQFPLCVSDNHGWHGDFHLNQEYLGQFCWAFSGNRPELIENVFQPLIDFIPEGNKFAETKMNQIHPTLGPRKGILYPVDLAPGGYTPTGYIHNQVSNASLTGQLFVWNYEYYRDLDWLRQTGYPFLRELGDFWESHLIPDPERPDRLISYGATYEKRSGKNPVIDLALARRVLTTLIAFSKDLGVDADKRPQWQAILDRMSELPTKSIGDKNVFIAHEGFARTPGNCELEAPIFPSELINLASPEKDLQAAIFTFQIVLKKWSAPKMGIFGTRLGLPPEEFFPLIKSRNFTCPASKTWGMRRNLTIGVFHASGATLEFLQSSMLQSFGEEIRLFPCPPKKDAEFRQLRARGAFVVSADLKNGVVGGVKILSEKGRDCTLINSWTKRKVQVVRNDQPAETVTGNRLTFKTTAGETLELKAN